MKPRWDILICSVVERHQMLERLIESLHLQIEETRAQVNILVLIDNKVMKVGTKRNNLLDMATADYVCFIDDDDRVPEDYVKTIYPLLDGVDYIGFNLQHYWNGEKSKPTKHSLYFDRWHDDEQAYYRNVTHLNPIRRELAITQRFAEKNRGEDEDWGIRLYKSGIVKSEHYIEKVMYHYDFNTETSLSIRGD